MESIENNKSNISFVKTDDTVIINEQCIRWVRQMGDCLEVCVKADGCFLTKYYKNTHTICKINNPLSYDKLDNHFEKKTVYNLYR